MRIELDQQLAQIYYADAPMIKESANGVILKTRRISDDQYVALKVMQTRDMDDPERNTVYTNLKQERIKHDLVEEIAFLKKLEEATPVPLIERHILPILDYGVWPDNSYDKGSFPAFAMPLAGKNLSVWLSHSDAQQSFPFSPDEFFRWARQIASALETVHKFEDEQGLSYAYRDLKPSNLVFLNDDLFLIDFGAQKRLERDLTHTITGTRNWMAPEIALPSSQKQIGKKDNIRFENNFSFGQMADLYSLGLTLFWLLGRDDQPSSQGILAQKRDSRGEPVAGADEHWGKIGGMTEAEKKRLRKNLNTLLNLSSDTGTIINAPVKSRLPDLNEIANKTFQLIDNLLSIRAEDRPTAKEVRGILQNLAEHLSPKIKGFEVEAPVETTLEKDIEVTVRVRGRGLPSTGNWLDVQVAGLECLNIEPVKYGEWKASFKPAQDIGKYKIVAYAVVSGETVESEPVFIEVKANADQLWKVGKFAAALIIEPDRKEWLDQIRSETKNNGKKCCEWLERLQDVYEILDQNKELRTHTRFSREFFRLEDECRKHNVYKKKKTFKKRYLGCLFPILISFAAIFAIIINYLPQEEPNDGVPLPSITAPPIEPTGPPVPTLFSLTFAFSPEDAEVKFKGSDWKYTKGMRLPPGKYEIEVTREGYISYEDFIHIDNKDALKTIKLKKKECRLTLTTTPSDAEVEFLGLDIKYTAGMTLDPGTYKIRVIKIGYQAYEEEIELSYGHNTITIPPLERTKTKSRITTDPIDSKKLVQVVQGMALFPGAYPVKTTKSEYEWGDSNVVEIEYEDVKTSIMQKKKECRLTLITKPLDAEVEFLGQDIKYTAGMTLDPGIYKIRVDKTGYQAYEKDIELSFGHQTITIPPLKRVQAELIISTDPESVNIQVSDDKKSDYINYVKAMPVGLTTTFPLYPGDYTVKVTKDNYETFTGSVTIAYEDVFKKIKLKKLSQVVFENVPEQAEILIVQLDNEKKRIITNKPKRALEPGRYEIRIWKRGYQPYRQEIKVISPYGEIHTLSIPPLKRLLPKLFIKTKPSDIRIRILNIKPKFEQGMELTPGLYKIEASKIGHKTQIKNIHIKKTDTEVSIDIELKKNIDPKEVSSLTPEEAKKIVQSNSRYLYLPKLKIISPEIAKILAPFGERTLSLGGLKYLNPIVAQNLVSSAKWGGETIRLDGLESISPQVAKIISRFKGTEISLNGLKNISPSVAKYLAQFEGQFINLNGLRSIEPETAKHLSQFGGDRLPLHGLVSINPEVAEHLAQLSVFILELRGLKDINLEVAEKLALSKASELWLSSLKNISPQIAEKLSLYKGEAISLVGIERMDSKVAMNLSRFKGNTLYLHDLKDLSPEAARWLVQIQKAKIHFSNSSNFNPEIQNILCKGLPNRIFPKDLCEETMEN